MDLDRHIAILWKRRRIVIGGIILALVTALLAAYQPSSSGLVRRGSEQWSSSSLVLVTQQGFPWGRVTLPGAPAPGTTSITPDATTTDPSNLNHLKFADPTRFSSLAMVYSVMSYSDRVRAGLPGNPAPEQITAVPFDPTGRGDAQMPIIQVTTLAASAAAADKLNRETVVGLRKVIVNEQEQNQIPAKDRVQLQTLKEPAPPLLVAGRSWTSSMLAFLLCIGAAIALAHIAEGLAMSRARKAEPALLGANGASDGLELGLKPDPSFGGGRVRSRREADGSHAGASTLSEYRNRLRG
jgi:hypothetical protein